jgi:hypothetical protein
VEAVGPGGDEESLLLAALGVDRLAPPSAAVKGDALSGS